MPSSAKATDAIALAVLFLQTLMVGWMSCVHSPNIDEPAHLASGVAHWQLGRFKLYRVNPPLVRGLAALPALLAGPETSYSGWRDSPYSRAEFSLGRGFVEANRDRAIRFFVLARWACLPLLFAGGWCVYLWAKQLYSARCGLIAVTLYAFSPNMLAYGASITPDMGAAAMGLIAGYTFWTWLRSPSLGKVILAGVMLGLAELTKTTWIVLFGLWPCLWLTWRHANRANQDPLSERASARGLAAILLIALYVLNLGYGFEGSFKKLGDYTFISEALSGRHHTEQEPDNCFKASLLAHLPLPVPENYVRGIDVQKFDFEVGKWSYIRGQHKHGGWWWYYLYALAVKEPIGNLILVAIVSVFSVWRAMRGGPWLDELVLLAPALVVFLLVSSQTGFSRYVRYILPCMPFVYIWMSKAAFSWCTAPRAWKMCVLGCLVWSTTSSLWIAPQCMSYFNELAGGPRAGHRHLLDASIDWAQDFLYLKDWTREHPDAAPLGIALFGERFCDPRLAGLEERPVPHGLVEGVASASNEDLGPQPGWYAISVCHVYGYRLLEHDQPVYAYFQEFEPVATVNYSIYIYHITPADANRVRRKLGLPELPGGHAATGTHAAVNLESQARDLRFTRNSYEQTTPLDAGSSFRTKSSARR